MTKIEQYYRQDFCHLTDRTRIYIQTHDLLNGLMIYSLLRIRVIVLNATFNKVSVTSWLSFLLVVETGVSGENHRTAQLYRIKMYRVHLA